MTTETANKIVLVDNRVERAKDFLLYQFKDKQKINYIVEALVEELQEAENTLIDMQTLRMLENAEGVILDNIGDKLKVKRSELDDLSYKTAIKVKILRKTNKSTQADIANIFRTLTQDDDPSVKTLHPYVVELAAVLSCITQTTAGIDELFSLFPANTGIRLIDKPSRPLGFAGSVGTFPLSSVAFNTPQGQMSSLIKSKFGIAGDPRFKEMATYIPPEPNIPSPSLNPYLEYTSVAIGSVLTVNDGVWSGELPITFLYQWFVAGLAVDGETNNTYTILAGDEDKLIHCRVIAENIDGQYLTVTDTVSFSTVVPTGIVDNLGLGTFYNEDNFYQGTLPPPASFTTATIGLRFDSTGVVTPYDQTGDRTPVDYLTVTGVGAANDYEIFVSKESGDNLTSPNQIDIWQDLSSDRQFSITVDIDVYSFAASGGNFAFTVRNKTSGDTESRTITLSASIIIEP